MKDIVEEFFRSLEARDAKRIAALFAESAEIEDPVGSDVVRGRAAIEASFADGFVRMVRSAEITTVYAAEAADRVAVHWRMLATSASGRVVEAEGVDVVTVDGEGKVVRLEGYWDAAGFVGAVE